MDVGIAVDLIKALGLVIDAQDAGRVGHPAARSSRLRAREVAEEAAMRRLLTTDSFTAALTAGSEAYEREMSYFGPLSLVRESAEFELDESESQTSNVISLNR